MSDITARQDMVHRPTAYRDTSAMLLRIRELERRTAAVVAEVDAGGAAWTAANPSWIDPATVLPWLELRVTNDAGTEAHIYRACPDSTGQVWRKSTT